MDISTTQIHWLRAGDLGVIPFIRSHLQRFALMGGGPFDPLTLAT
jgi:hypothetical protein